MTALPQAQQWIIEAMTEMETAEMIEEHINYVDKDGRSVHLPMQFVRHFMKRHDGVLPTIVAVATLPVVLADGHILGSEKGFDRPRGIMFETQSEVTAVIPKREDCGDEAVANAMRFLTDEWLTDVLTDYAGKCTIIAAGLTIIERNLLNQRPAFFVTAGRRGGGKTTLIEMMINGVLGLAPAASAWSTNEDERRKALLSYFMYGCAYILWDNIPRGTQISCPHIEKSCTASYYADRKLGVTEMAATAASTIHFFTGNNIGPRGDMASRSLKILLDVERADPENRNFTHPDPVGWTLEMRAEILGALYTILLGNPFLDQPRDAPCETRYKMWWRLVGSAIEHAASLANPEKPVRFRDLFLEQESDDEESGDLTQVLIALSKQFPTTFKAANVAELVNNRSDVVGKLLREFLYPDIHQDAVVTSKSVGKHLKDHVKNPVARDGRTYVLRALVDRTGTLTYFVSVGENDGA
jgi:hypothetical protein